jgi:hypothetical protein
MKALQSLQYKTRIGLLLAALLACLLVNNILGQSSFESIQKDAQSIYEDRLMPSTFIFDLQEHLYQEQTLLQSGMAGSTAAVQQHRAAVNGLVGRYEKTVLTKEERREWLKFKGHLMRMQEGPASEAELGQAMRCLTHLNAIQAGVAKDLETRMTAAANASTIRSYLEFALLIIVGAVTLSLIGYSRNVFQKPVTQHRPSLN